MNEPEPTMYAFEYFYHMDVANAAIHMKPVRFSPITFELAKRLSAAPTQNVAHVLSHIDQYPLDEGR